MGKSGIFFAVHLKISRENLCFKIASFSSEKGYGIGILCNRWNCFIEHTDETHADCFFSFLKNILDQSQKTDTYWIHDIMYWSLYIWLRMYDLSNWITHTQRPTLPNTQHTNPKVSYGSMSYRHWPIWDDLQVFSLFVCDDLQFFLRSFVICVVAPARASITDAKRKHLKSISYTQIRWAMQNPRMKHDEKLQNTREGK